MNVRMPIVLFAILAFAQSLLPLPAAADTGAPADLAPAVVQLEATSPEACLARAKGDHFAQITCCKDHKGVCGCRAGKIVCCDTTSSSEPGCTCHGDEGIAE